MIIVGTRIADCLQQFFTDSQRLRIVLCQEIVAIVRIWIADSDGSLWRLPVHWSNGIEHPLTADRTRRHLCQIVCLPQIVTCQALWLQGAPIAIDLHLRGVRETTSLDELIGELVETRSWHTDLRPGTFTKHGMFCIARRFTFGSCSCLQNRLRLHIEHETHQFLISAVSIYQGHKRHIKQSLFAGHTDMLRHCGQRGQRLTTDLFITTDIRFAHIDKLRIGDADGIDRISITRPQGFLPGEDRQQRVDPDLTGSQIKNRLCLCYQAETHHQHAAYQPSHTLHHIINVSQGPFIASLTIKLQYLTLLKPTFQVVVDVHRSHPCWRTCIEDVACFQRKELRDIGDNLIHPIEHI